jgi:hypothetical protein
MGYTYSDPLITNLPGREAAQDGGKEIVDLIEFDI